MKILKNNTKLVLNGKKVEIISNNYNNNINFVDICYFVKYLDGFTPSSYMLITDFLSNSDTMQEIKILSCILDYNSDEIKDIIDCESLDSDIKLRDYLKNEFNCDIIFSTM